MSERVPFSTKQYRSMPTKGTVIADTEAHTGCWAAIQVVDSPSFDVTGNLIGEEEVDYTALNTKLNQGFILQGDWRSIKLTDGIVIAYGG